MTGIYARNRAWFEARRPTLAAVVETDLLPRPSDYCHLADCSAVVGPSTRLWGFVRAELAQRFVVSVSSNLKVCAP